MKNKIKQVQAEIVHIDCETNQLRRSAKQHGVIILNFRILIQVSERRLREMQQHENEFSKRNVLLASFDEKTKDTILTFREYSKRIQVHVNNKMLELGKKQSLQGSTTDPQIVR